MISTRDSHVACIGISHLVLDLHDEPREARRAGEGPVVDDVL